MVLAALLPLMAALLVLGLVWSRGAPLARSLQMGVVLAMCLVGSVLLLAPEIATSTRVVFLIDEENRAALQTLNQQVLQALQARQQVAAFDVAVLRGVNSNGPTRPDETGRSWTRGAFDSAEHSVTQDTPDLALRWATDRFKRRSLGERLADALLGRTLRIVIVSAHPASWGAVEEVGDAGQRAARAGITIDLLYKDALPRDAMSTANLHVLLPDPLPPNQPYLDAQFALRVSSPLLRQLLGTQLQWRRTCVVDPGLPKAELTSPETTELAEVTDQGAQVKVNVKELFKGQPVAALAAGYHLVRCRVQATVAGKPLVADGSAYAHAQYQTVLIVSGNGHRFEAHHHPGHPAATAAELRSAWDNLLPGVGHRWYESVIFRDSDFINESELSARLDADVGDRAPLLIVLHDVRGATIQSVCPKLRRRVSDGVHLLVAGAPTKQTFDACDVLPAFADEKGGAEWRYDRRPRLTFVLDGSRLGSALYKPPPVPALLDENQLKALHIAKGKDLQRLVMDALTKKLSIRPQTHAPSGAEPTGIAPFYFVDTLPTPWPGTQPNENDMLVQSQLALRLGQLAGRPSRPAANEALPADFIVVFANNVVQERSAKGALKAFLEQGATVFVVQIKTPLAPGLSKVSGDYNRSADPGDLVAELQQSLRAAHEKTPRIGGPAIAAEEAADRLLVLELDVTAADAEIESRTEDVARQILERMRSRLTPRGMFFIPHRYARFIDEGVGRLLSQAPAPAAFGSLPDEQRWAAPVFFQRLYAPASRDTAVYASSTEDVRTVGSLGPRTLLVGRAYGLGQVLVAGYSLFEGALEPEPFGPGLWNDKVQSRIYTRGKVDAWGPQRIIDFSGLSSILEPAPSTEPRIVRIEASDRKGRIDVTVSERIVLGNAIRDPVLSRCDAQDPQGPFFGPCNETTAAALTLQRVSPVEQRLVYGIMPTNVYRQCAGAPACVSELNGARFYLGNPTSRPPKPSADLTAQQALAALARYTGGRDIPLESLEELPGYRYSLLLPAGLALVLGLAALWGMRLVRRLRPAGHFAEALDRERRAMLVETPVGVVAQAGEALGRPVTHMHAGAFAGFRAFEPGDRLDAAVRDDVFLMSRGVRIVPRVAQRIEERGRRVQFYVHLGASMRVPSSGGFRPKLAAAARALQLMAEMACQGRAEVTIIPVGLAREGKPLGPFFTPPGVGELDRYLAGVSAMVGRWTFEPSFPEFEQGAAMVYVSDFLNEDLDGIASYASKLEEEGSSFGAVHVYSRSELELVDVGVLPSADTVSDRSEWLAADVGTAHHAFLELLLEKFAATKGGLAVVCADQRAAEMLYALRDTRIIDLLR